VGVRFPFWFAPSELVASPSSLCQVGPGYQLCPSPPVTRARPRRHRLPATPRRPAPRLECRRAVTTPPSFPLPLIPLLTPPSSMTLKPLTPALTPATPPRCFPDPYKRASTTPGAFHPSLSFSHLLSCAGTPPPHRVSRPPPSHRDARPPDHRSRPGESPTELPASHSPSPTPWPTPMDTGAVRGRSSGEPGAAVHGRSTVDRGSGGPRPRAPGLRKFLYENNPLNQYFWEFCKEAPVFLCN
jgi:hypothetical protein